MKQIGCLMGSVWYSTSKIWAFFQFRPVFTQSAKSLAWHKVAKVRGSSLARFWALCYMFLLSSAFSLSSFFCIFLLFQAAEKWCSPVLFSHGGPGILLVFPKGQVISLLKTPQWLPVQFGLKEEAPKMENVTSLTGSVSSSPWTLFLAHAFQAHSDLRAFVLTMLYLSFSIFTSMLHSFWCKYLKPVPLHRARHSRL